MQQCLSCEIAKGNKIPLRGKIIETTWFNAHQDVAYPVPGLVILASNRHFFCFDEMTDDEAIDYMDLLRRVRAAQRDVLKIQHVYYFYNEDTTHHFHMWIVPRYEWMESFGRSVESIRPILLHAREHMSDAVNLKKVEETIVRLKQALHSDKYL